MLPPYPLARALLFRIDAEAAHDLTMRWLERTQNTPLQALWRQARVSDPVRLAGLDFPNRVGLGAGLDKNARCLDALAAIGFGFVEVGTVTPRPQPGNPRPRMFRLPAADALINRFGFNNEGLDRFIESVAACRRRQAVRTSAGHPAPPLLGLNIGKNATTPIADAANDYLACLDAVHGYADYVTVNISSPNTKDLRALQSDEALDGLLSELMDRRRALGTAAGRHVPLFVKIAPDLDPSQVEAIATSLHRHGVDGVIAANTTVTRDAVRALPHANETGGLSGAPVRASSNRIIAQLRKRMGPKYPIIGVGGILSGADAVDKVVAGADVVQIYTGLIYRGPGLVTEVAHALQQRNAS